ncbi:S8 family serine peptidase [Acinetobacter stercoris]|uniref:Subtilisin E n=1 Tax=Acinetobacter stercoris TaxID=2126983 RepID=A0A2U3N3E1_9GAMM|nr:S8 family serine peptidase [Acinetobacter stercoris]SPL72153.1 Subtilisin E precursor [Acinetobacter stercoris]
MKLNKLFILCLGALIISNTYAATNDAESAKKRLLEPAKQKIHKAQIDLNALLKNDSNDLIIEYNVGSTVSTASGVQKRNFIASNKQAIRSAYSGAKGLTILRDYNALPLTAYRINNRDTLVQLLNDPNIKAVYPNRINTTNTRESLPLIHQPQTVQNGFTGAGTSVVVVDTGVNYRHADFGNCTGTNTPLGATVREGDRLPDDTCRVSRAFDLAPDDGALDDDGHGTNVAAIVAQVAPQTKIIGIDVFRTVTSWTGEIQRGAADTDSIAAINWAVNNAQTHNIKAINLSLGTPGRSYNSICENSYTTPFANARAAGIVPVVASGNDNFSNGISSPACTAGAVSVGAVYDVDRENGLTWGPVGNQCTDRIIRADQISCFSNSGRLLTLLAPGALITAGGHTLGGTSQAAPHVAGAIALLRANDVRPLDANGHIANDAETIDQTIARLQDNGVEITDTRNGLNFRRIDLQAATRTLGFLPPPQQAPVVVPRRIS